jgi:hypothetical protein
MSQESEYLRDAIRSGAIDANRDRPQWENAVNRIYEIERAEEAAQSDRGDGSGEKEHG